jgi:hypothetical protein
MRPHTVRPGAAPFLQCLQHAMFGLVAGLGGATAVCTSAPPLNTPRCPRPPYLAATAALHAGCHPEPLAMSDITFKQPVTVGSIVEFDAKVSSTAQEGRIRANWEVSSCCGRHATCRCPLLPALCWLPSLTPDRHRQPPSFLFRNKNTQHSTVLSLRV